MTNLDDYALSDRYTADDGRVFLTGIQSLARLPIAQLRIDALAGLNTAAFLSGYQGSPLGGFDQEVERALKQVTDLPIVAQPAVNEELAATSVMGSQLVSNQPDARYDGVLGIWYGKAPGFDRASDAIRHAVFAGTSRFGGAVALVGDDPACKSSTLPSASDAGLLHLKMPYLYPGDVQDILDLGRHAVALSRLSGLWTGIKIVTAVADGSGSIDLRLDRIVPKIPNLEVDGRHYVARPTGKLIAPTTNDLEREIYEVRLAIAGRYGAINNLNRVTVDPSDAWLGLVASGYTYRELMDALRRLGFETPADVEAAGIRVLQMQMPYPFDRQVVRRFARGLTEVIVVEEKGSTLERMVKDALYGGPDQPTVVGKEDDNGASLLQAHGFLTADLMVDALRRRMTERLGDRLAPRPTPMRERVLIPLTSERSPYFCSGCPHNWGTKVPDNALVGAGIGCSGMALLMDEDKVGDIAGITCMGSEGAQWIGMEPFVDRDHFIQNLGDGTYFHSGQLAIQAAIAAGSHMTYKLLFNGTVAMTGGQDAAGGIEVREIAKILLAQGATEVVVTTDDLDEYQTVDMPSSKYGGKTKVWDRTRIVEAQRYLAGVPGVSVLIHDQSCAAQARRLRKRGKIEAPTAKVAINHRICEACGDCGEVSNCLSVQSVETPLGPKTAIDQTTCNLDYSCLEGDCPSFMMVEPVVSPSKKGKPKRARSTTSAVELDRSFPDPELIGSPDSANIRFAGIGGTGVITVAQIVGTAALLDGWEVRGLDQTGLSQKAGPVVSDLRLTKGDPAASNLVGGGDADAIVAFDLLVGAADQTLTAADRERTVLITSSTETPTGEMVGKPDAHYPELVKMQERVAAATRSELNRFVDAGAVTRGILGDGATANVFMLGVAVQSGAVPVSSKMVERAIDLNGVAVEANLAAFRWGRQWVVDEAKVREAASIPGEHQNEDDRPASDPLAEAEPPRELMARIMSLGVGQELRSILAMLCADLVAYQDQQYAGAYLDVVAISVDAERSVRTSSEVLTEAVARGLHKLMAYKDEYEVARLLISPEAVAAAEAVGGPGAKVTWKLHPPVLKALGMSRKIEVNARSGKPLMAMLAKGKRLRGTSLDPFGRAAVRRLERNLVAEFVDAIELMTAKLNDENFDSAVQLAAAAMDVRGFDDLKLQRAAAFRARLEQGIS